MRQHFLKICVYTCKHTTMKQIVLLSFIALSLFQCKKESSKNDEPAGLNPNTKEYVSFDIEGLDGLSSFLFQDADGYKFKGYHDKCPISPTYVLHQVEKSTDPYNNPQFSIFLGTATMPTKFKDGVKVQTYQVKDLTNNNAAITFSHSRVNKGGLGSSTMNGTAGNEFEITKIETIDGIEYAFGKFKIYMHTPSPGNKEYYWVKNGKFKIKI